MGGRIMRWCRGVRLDALLGVPGGVLPLLLPVREGSHHGELRRQARQPVEVRRFAPERRRPLRDEGGHGAVALHLGHHGLQLAQVHEQPVEGDATHRRGPHLPGDGPTQRKQGIQPQRHAHAPVCEGLVRQAVCVEPVLARRGEPLSVGRPDQLQPNRLLLGRLEHLRNTSVMSTSGLAPSSWVTGTVDLCAPRAEGGGRRSALRTLSNFAASLVCSRLKGSCQSSSALLAILPHSCELLLVGRCSVAGHQLDRSSYCCRGVVCVLCRLLLLCVGHWEEAGRQELDTHAQRTAPSTVVVMTRKDAGAPLLQQHWQVVSIMRRSAASTSALIRAARSASCAPRSSSAPAPPGADRTGAAGGAVGGVAPLRGAARSAVPHASAADVLGTLRCCPPSTTAGPFLQAMRPCPWTCKRRVVWGIEHGRPDDDVTQRDRLP